MKNIIRIILIIVLIGLIGKAEFTDSKTSSDIDSMNRLQYQLQQSEIQLQYDLKQVK